MVSEVLVGIAVLLAGINLLFFLWKKLRPGKKENPFESGKNETVIIEDNKFRENNNQVEGVESTALPANYNKSLNKINAEMHKLAEGIKAVSTKTDFIYKKVLRLEDYTEKHKVPANLQKMDKKLEKLEEFKRNTTIELAAIKDRLKELKILEGKKSSSLEDKKIKEKIRKLVFNNR